MTSTDRPTITCVGSTMIDLIFYTDKVPQTGETVFGKSFAQGFGGKGANQAVMASLLGAQVAMVNALGQDAFGRDTIENFKSFGVDVTAVKLLEQTHSGVANIIVDGDGDNRIVLAAGANLLVTPEMVEQAFAALPAPNLVLSQLEVPQDAIQRGFELGREAGAITVLNPAPASPVAPGILAATDWLVPNETEFAVLYEAQFGSAPADHEASALKFADELGVKLLVTLGEQGAVVAEPGGRETTRKFEAKSVKAVDTTGAGDAFLGGFTFGLASGMSLEDAIALGSAVAADSVTRPGTQLSYARGEDLQRIVDSV